MLTIFDSHAHYDNPRFDADRDAILADMGSKGVKRILNAGVNINSSRVSVELSGRYDFIYASVGVHPHDCIKTPDRYICILRDLAANKKVMAIGEIGLDYHYNYSPPEMQREFFTAQLELARELNLPVIIHSRDAAQETLSILKKFPDLRGIAHCFSYSPEIAEIFIEMGYYIGFTGVVTFAGAKKPAKAVESVPLERLLIETDCPYMAPEPYRGKRCDSSMLDRVIGKIAQIKGISEDDVANACYKNACDVFGMDVNQHFCG
ncbi:MAG: TatD family hydrolase [Oscillospiraceae bacterium]|nr:TatD family hydrolase [Oscillospiraceae bacterium]